MENVTRYSDKELELFKIHIEQKIEKAEEDLNFVSNQIQDLNESMNEDGDIADDSFNNSELDMLLLMKNRQQKYINDLKNAIYRIRNKNYGICILTGRLIDKRRLMAVPTTSKCLEAKTEADLAEKLKCNKTFLAKPKKVLKKPVVKTIVKKQLPSNIDILGEDLELEDDFYEDDIVNEEYLEDELND